MTSRNREPFRCLPIAGESFWEPGQRDSRRTAVREAAYIRRTKFKQGDAIHDFAWRGEDLFMISPILPDDAPSWTHRPYLRWRLADQVVERGTAKDAIRAWHICADLPVGLSRGRWGDEAEAIVREVLPSHAVAEICGHVPIDHPPHMHILVAARAPGARGYGRPLAGLGDLLQDELRERWLAWCGAAGSEPTNMRLAA